MGAVLSNTALFNRRLSPRFCLLLRHSFSLSTYGYLTGCLTVARLTITTLDLLVNVLRQPPGAYWAGFNRIGKTSLGTDLSNFLVLDREFIPALARPEPSLGTFAEALSAFLSFVSIFHRVRGRFMETKMRLFVGKDAW